MKAAIITLHTVSNYGSCLQTYASQSIFEKRGLDVEIIDYYRADNLPEYSIEKAFNGRRLQKYRSLWEKAPWLKAVVSLPMGLIVKRQRKPFDDFRKEYLHLSSQMYRSSKELEAEPPQAEIYCTGSDQVWNSVWNQGFEEPFYLTFAPKDAKRIAFAASIGREEIDEWEKPLMREALSKYSAISMREKSGVKILRELGFSETELVLDPTLMLDKEDWSKIATLPKKIRCPYLLVYQLNKSDRFVKYAEAVARKYSLNIVKISYGIYDTMSSATTLIAPEVTDFIGLFLNASYVITDSFHATAYALNFSIPFSVIAPERFSTRITSILSLTGTEDRLVKDYSDVTMFDRRIDFTYSSAQISIMRNASQAFLERALVK